MYRPWMDEIGDGAGVQRRLTKGVCTCGDRIYQGLDADRAAIPYRVNRTELDRGGEVVALLNGAATFDLVPLKHGGTALQHRTKLHIQQKRRFVVVAQHFCALAWPQRILPEENPLPETPDEPPF